MKEQKELSTEEKVQKAVRFIKAISSQTTPFIAYSGGKGRLRYCCGGGQGAAGLRCP